MKQKIITVAMTAALGIVTFGQVIKRQGPSPALVQQGQVMQGFKLGLPPL